MNEFKTPSLINSVFLETLPSSSHFEVNIPFSSSGLSMMESVGFAISCPVLSFKMDLPLLTFSPLKALMNVCRSPVAA